MIKWLLSRRAIAAALVAAVLTVGLATTSAEAQYRRHYHRDPGAAIVGGLALGILGAGIIASQRDYYDDYPGYYGAPYGYYHRPRAYYRPYGYYQRPYYGRRFVGNPRVGRPFYGRPVYGRPVYGRPQNRR